jgi:hypothetical protein
VVALLGAIGLFAAARLAGSVVRGVPGHTGALWLPPLFLSLAYVRRIGAPTVTALVGSTIAGSVGEQGFLALPSDVAAGLTLDLLGWGRDRLVRLPWALLAGATAHAAKWGVHTFFGTITGTAMGNRRFEPTTVLLLHVAFGLAGGFLGWAGLRALRKARPDTPPEPA